MTYPRQPVPQKSTRTTAIAIMVVVLAALAVAPLFLMPNLFGSKVTSGPQATLNAYARALNESDRSSTALEATRVVNANGIWHDRGAGRKAVALAASDGQCWVLELDVEGHATQTRKAVAQDCAGPAGKPSQAPSQP